MKLAEPVAERRKRGYGRRIRAEPSMFRERFRCNGAVALEAEFGVLLHLAEWRAGVRGQRGVESIDPSLDVPLGHQFGDGFILLAIAHPGTFQFLRELLVPLIDSVGWIGIDMYDQTRRGARTLPARCSHFFRVLSYHIGISGSRPRARRQRQSPDPSGLGTRSYECFADEDLRLQVLA